MITLTLRDATAADIIIDEFSPHTSSSIDYCIDHIYGRLCGTCVCPVHSRVNNIKKMYFLYAADCTVHNK